MGMRGWGRRVRRGGGEGGWYEGVGKVGGMRGWGRWVEDGYRGWVQGQEYEAWVATVRWV